MKINFTIFVLITNPCLNIQVVVVGFHAFNCSIESINIIGGLINFDNISLLNNVTKISEPKIQNKYAQL